MIDFENEINLTEHENTEDIFYVIPIDDYDKSIDEFCQRLKKGCISDDFSIGEMEVFIACLKSMLEKFKRPFTIVQEFYHIDSSYRDSYYNYFSNQHFIVKRYSRRLSFFELELDDEKFFSNDESTKKEIEDGFIGACVLNPLSIGSMGRTLIDPKHLMDNDLRPVYVRLSTFDLNIYGKKLSVKAFPYRMQDEVTMRCAEVSLLNLLEYFSNTYKDYKTVMPSDILDIEQKHSYERVIPSKGTSYPILSKVLEEFGFSPRLYNRTSIDKCNLSRISQDDELKRCLHYYVESGIPVALNLLPIGGNGSGHSIVCIGHGKFNKELIGKAYKNKWISWEYKDSSHPIIDSADFYDKYVVIDDNKPVYQVKPFLNLSAYSEMRVENIAVPLYKRMFLDAVDAASIVKSVLHDEYFGIDAWCKNYLPKEANVITRLFMASSRSLKKDRVSHLKNLYAKEVYSLIPMPRFVWVCELYTEAEYMKLGNNGKTMVFAFGEIVIDATSCIGGGQYTGGLILMHYPGIMGIRFPEQKSNVFEDMVEIEDDSAFLGYQANLTAIE